ncbi:polysaccharide pyruvyl transferase family protein [Butyrivibrio sp. MC2021]|uniref:polysaccharide pyruvyl transferase family protein n=1 Tax=Butyrivibrio sp. MC2021 TaxID=1408306 RepID=UPI0006858313|nr:polysaccharide pyruvyl transferase family protein [Butyrivibrio sp. MC2021]
MNYQQYEKLYQASKRIDLRIVQSVLESEYTHIRDLIEIIEEVLSSSTKDPDKSSLNPFQNIISIALAMPNACETIDSGVDFLSLKSNQFDDEIFKLGTSIKNAIVHVSTETYANAGDYLLVKSLRRLIEKNSGKKSWIRLNLQKEVNPGIIESINQSKALVIGGGGLFLKDTNKNEISGWQWPISQELIQQIKVPIYVLGVGYNKFRNQEDFEPYFYENITALVEKSTFFGLRNHGSVNAVKAFLPNHLKDKVQYFPCATTVMSKLFDIEFKEPDKPIIAINCAFDRQILRFGNRKDYILSSIAKTAKVLSSDYDILCYLHCEPDSEMCSYMDNYEVPYGIVKLYESRDEKEMIEAYSLPRLVIGMRGHSQMVAFGCGTPTLSIISHDKIQWFLDDIGHPEWGIDVNDNQFDEKILACAQNMLSHSTEMRQEISQAQDQLWNILQTALTEHIHISVDKENS